MIVVGTGNCLIELVCGCDLKLARKVGTAKGSSGRSNFHRQDRQIRKK